MSEFFVYVDYTCESVSRPFYVGKGRLSRIQKRFRNKHHAHVAQQLGLNRVIVFESDNEQACLNEEIRLIFELQTYNPIFNMSLSDVRCNRTLGGEGKTGCKDSDETRLRKKIAHQGQRNNMFGKTHTLESIERMRKAHQGRVPTEEQRKKLKEALNTPEYRKTRSELTKERFKSFEARQKMSEAQKRRPPTTPETRRKMSESAKRRRTKPTIGI